MTMHGGRDEASPEQPLAAFGAAGEGGGAYRQDDAPHAGDPASAAPAGEVADPPRRSAPEIVTALASTPDDFARLIDGKSDEALSQPATDGEWGVVEILPHLRDWEEVYLGWFHQMLADEGIALADVDDSLWAIDHDYANEHVPGALARFADLREEVVHLLEALDDDAWAREAIHPRLGRVTLHQLADRMCDHDARHIEQARDALA